MFQTEEDKNRRLKLEKELIKQAQKEPEVFSELYQQNYSKIFGYVLKRVASVEIAQDITSETFFKALKNLKKFRWKNISFSSWLYRIASNETVNYFRKNKYKSISLEKFCEPANFNTPSIEIITAEDKLKQQTEFLELHQKIKKLKPIYQEVIVLKFFEKKKIKEIAEILSKREGTIKSLIHRSIKKLRKMMEQI